MEVHHHSHHPKKWKEYVTEFVMLFTAVTLGFFAENYREGIVEQHKKEKLLHSVVDNFKLDKKEIETHRNQIKGRIKTAEHFLVLLNTDLTTVNKIDFYRTILFFAENKAMILNEKTRNDAESKGYYTTLRTTDMPAIINKYNYWYNDYKELNLGVLEICKRFIGLNVPKIIEPDLVGYAYQLWLPETEEIKNVLKGNVVQSISKEYKDAIKFEIANKIVLLKAELNTLDTLESYADKAIITLEKNLDKH
ncbi:MAG: hypothetical protein ACK4V7_01040 [Chitinophagaceae bacterium]|jgi:hypothetical protein